VHEQKAPWYYQIFVYFIDFVKFKEKEYLTIFIKLHCAGCLEKAQNDLSAWHFASNPFNVSSNLIIAMKEGEGHVLLKWFGCQKN
jgi:hypothetical protein